METVGNILLKALGFVAFFAVAYFVLKHVSPNIFYKGWGSLKQEYGIADTAVPPAVRMQETSVRVGSETYNNTMQIGLAEHGIYLQRYVLAKPRGTLHIPYASLALQSPPKQSGFMGLPVYGVFKVNGVDIWIDSPYAEQIIERLPTP